MNTAVSVIDYQAAISHLAAVDADMARLIEQVGPCLHEAKPAREPYEALIRAVAYQQLHVRAGDAMLARLLALFPGQPFPSAEQVLLIMPETLRACGFSGRKIETLHAIAAEAISGLVPSLDESQTLDDETLVARLTRLKGIGRWTVEMLLIYTLQRPDILPVDDFGVREGYRFIKALERAPTPKQLQALAEAWSPFRTVAAWYLWRVPALPDYRKPGR